MKVLFLDIDGVLNSTDRARRGIPYAMLMPEGLVFLRHVHDYGVKIVVSSTWRRSYTVQELSQILSVSVHDVTPTSTLSHRGSEINSWLEKHAVERYCIIDDDRDMLPRQLPQCVFTACEHGIQKHHMDEVCRILCIPLSL